MASLVEYGGEDGRTIVNLRDLGTLAELADRQVVGALMAWQDRLVAGTNIDPAAMVFVVPPGVLIGVSKVFGTPLMRGDVAQPMVAIPAMYRWQRTGWHPLTTRPA